MPSTIAGTKTVGECHYEHLNRAVKGQEANSIAVLSFRIILRIILRINFGWSNSIEIHKMILRMILRWEYGAHS